MEKKRLKQGQKKYDVVPDGASFVVEAYGEKTGQRYSTFEEAQAEVDKLYEKSKTKK